MGTMLEGRVDPVVGHHPQRVVNNAHIKKKRIAKKLGVGRKPRRRRRSMVKIVGMHVVLFKGSNEYK